MHDDGRRDPDRGRLTITRVVGAALATVSLGIALLGCERERVDVAETDPNAAPGGDASAVPMFPASDASASPDGGDRVCDGGVPSPFLCGASCPNGYATIDGKPSCECCP